MISNRIGLPIGQYKCLYTKIPTKNLAAEVGRAIRICEGQTQMPRETLSLPNLMRMAMERNSPRALAPSLLPHNAMQLIEKLGSSFSSPKMGP